MCNLSLKLLACCPDTFYGNQHGFRKCETMGSLHVVFPKVEAESLMLFTTGQAGLWAHFALMLPSLLWEKISASIYTGTHCKFCVGYNYLQCCHLLTKVKLIASFSVMPILAQTHLQRSVWNFIHFWACRRAHWIMMLAAQLTTSIPGPHMLK